MSESTEGDKGGSLAGRCCLTFPFSGLIKSCRLGPFIIRSLKVAEEVESADRLRRGVARLRIIKLDKLLHNEDL